jgi:hypothetical protein
MKRESVTIIFDMLPIILSNVLLIISVGIILFVIVFRTKSVTPLYQLNFVGAGIGPAAVMATAMQSANNTSQMLELFFYLCVLGIPLALVCNIFGYILSRNNQSETVLIILKIPSIYAAFWILGFFSLAA